MILSITFRNLINWTLLFVAKNEGKNVDIKSLKFEEFSEEKIKFAFKVPYSHFVLEKLSQQPTLQVRFFIIVLKIKFNL